MTATERSRVSTPSDANTAHWQKETREYWPTGDLKRVTDAEGNITQYAYDAVGRTTLVTDPDTRRVGTVYDLAGQALCTWRGWDTTSAPTNCTWNPATYTGTGKVRYAQYDYTLNGKQDQVVDANNNTTDYLFDGFDRLRYTLFPRPTDGTRCTPPSNPSSTTAPTCLGSTAADKQTYERHGWQPHGIDHPGRPDDHHTISTVAR